ncbi:hypothetical protein V3C99_010854 [Haemonchus contortus]
MHLLLIFEHSTTALERQGSKAELDGFMLGIWPVRIFNMGFVEQSLHYFTFSYFERFTLLRLPSLQTATLHCETSLKNVYGDGKYETYQSSDNLSGKLSITIPTRVEFTSPLRVDRPVAMADQPTPDDPFAALKKMSPPSKESAEDERASPPGSSPHVLDMRDPRQRALYKIYRPEIVTPKVRGVELLKMPWYNKGMAFTLYERQFLGIHGLIPPAMMTAEQQAYRTMVKLRQLPDDLSRYIEMDNLQDRNERLFYRVICENVKELMRIVYTPTVGLACQKFGFIFRNPKGLYITINDNTISRIYQILANWPTRDVRAIVVTDGERILGLGDLGAYGMGIPIGKLALYVALGGVHPKWCLPIMLDVGTNNEKLLKDPFYTGLRRKRTRGAAYDLLLDYFMIACTKRFGRNVLIQFEDFGNLNAYRLLDKYKKQYNMFNDDIQGTAAVVVAGLLTTTRVTKMKLRDYTIVFFGAGGAATGVSEMCVRQMVEEGLSVEEACSQIYMMDIDGLITKNRIPKLTPRHLPFAKDMEDTKDLLEVVRAVKPHAIIGASTKGGAFTEEIIRTMAEFNERPIIFALSNPTANAECTAEQAIRLTDGRVLFASGSPFENVKFKGRTYKPGQGNNSYIFPGVGLGAVLFESKHVTDKIFLLAARVVSTSVTEKSLQKYVRIYPRLKDIRELSIKIATAVGKYLYHHNLATLYPEPHDIELYIRQHIYSTEYEETINKLYEWPASDLKQGYPVPQLERKSMEDE